MRSYTRHTHKRAIITALVAIGAIAAFFGQPLMVSAADPTVTITNTPSQLITTNTITVTGSFKTDTNLRSVQVVLCKVRSATTCGDYLQTTSGVYGSAWKANAASVVTTDKRSGTYSLTYTNLIDARYRATVYAVDQVTNKGPRSTLDFTVQTTPAQPTSKFISIIFGRTSWQAATGADCTDTAGARTLEQNAQDLQVRGMFGVGGVVVNRTSETGLTCFNRFALQPSWEQLAMLRDTYGWKFISQGMNYADMTLMNNDEERYQESGATLPIFEMHGHNRAWGAFNYANNRQDLAAQTVVTKYFAFGRKYDTGINTKSSVGTFPYIMNTNSVNGGRCNNAALPCYNMTVTNNRRTTSVDTLKKVLNPADNGWGVVQYYRLVEGRRGAIGDAFAWDCTSANWRDRWTSMPELSCRESFLEVIDGRSTTATVADPATVAETWGILPTAR